MRLAGRMLDWEVVVVEAGIQEFAVRSRRKQAPLVGLDRLAE